MHIEGNYNQHMIKTPSIEIFQGDTIPYPTYSRRWVITSIIPQDRLCCIIFLGFSAIIFTYKDDRDSGVLYLF